MKMISDETIELIWKCKREIRVGNDLLVEMNKQIEAMRRDEKAEKIRDAFGRERDLTLGIPCGDNAHKLINVSPSLSLSVIRAHIATMEAKLVEANERARIELGMTGGE